MTEDKAKTCPVCKGQPSVINPMWLRGTKSNTAIVCQNYETCHVNVAVYASSKPEAIRKWNTRA